MSTSVSISKLKSELRQAQRLISRNDKLNASLRVETERRIESLKSQIQEEQQRRGITDGSPQVNNVNSNKTANGATIAASTDAQDPANLASQATEKKKKATKKEDKYKMLRHVEFKKSTRRLKQAERDLASVIAKLDALADDGSKEHRKTRKALEKERSAAETKRDQARIDAWYGSTFPPQYKYVALYPAGSYVEFGELHALPNLDPQASPESALASYAAGMPPARKPDEVRSYWRAVVKARLDRGDIEGNPTKSNITTKAKKPSKPAQGTAQAGETAHSEEEASAPSTPGQDEDADDFFE